MLLFFHLEIGSNSLVSILCLSTRSVRRCELAFSPSFRPRLRETVLTPFLGRTHCWTGNRNSKGLDDIKRFAPCLVSVRNNHLAAVAGGDLNQTNLLW